jgi:hypothetical protein
MNEENIHSIKIHNKHGDVVGEFVPKPSVKGLLMGMFSIEKRWNPLAIEKWAWLTSLHIAKFYEIAWKAGFLEDTPDSVRKLFEKCDGTFCFACKNMSVRPHFLFGRLLGYSCTTKNCPTHDVIIPKTLVRRIDEMPDYSLE